MKIRNSASAPRSIRVRFLFLLLLAGCGGGTAAYSQAPTAVVVTVKPLAPFVPVVGWDNAIFVQAGLTQQFAATVLGDATNSGVTWSASPDCGVQYCGTIDASGKYTAPTTAPGFDTYYWTILARSVADPTKTGSFYVIVTPVPTAIAVTPNNVTVQINGVQQFAWTGSPLGTFPSVTWNVSGAGCVGPDCGTIDSAGKYTAPAAAPNPPMVTVTVSPSADASMTGLAAVNLGTNPNNAKLAGHYAFLMTGWDLEGVYNFAGSFVADGTGKITDGKWDSASSSLFGRGQNASFTGMYSIGSDGRGSMVLGGNYPRGLTFSLALGSFAGGVATRGRISEVEPGNPTLRADMGGGVLARQDPSAFSTAAIAGGFAFAFNTPSQGSFHCRDLFANGRFTASNGTLSAGQADVVSIANGAGCNVPSAYSSDLSFTGTYTVNANGRGTAAFTFASQNPVFTHFAFYVVSASELFFVETDPWGPIGDLAHERSPLAGVALQQSAVQFSASSLTGPEVLTVTDDQVQDNLGVTLAVFDGISTLTGTTDVVNNTSSIVSPVSVNGTYSVDPDGLGRGVLTFSGDQSPKPFYLISPGKGFILGTTTRQPGVVGVGALEPQFGGPFGNSSLSGTYVLDVSPPYLSPLFSPGAGLLSADGARNLNGVVDSADGTGSGFGSTFTGAYSIDANGRGTLATNPNSGPPLNWILYVADPSKIFLRQAISGGGQHATIETPVTLTQRATFSMADRGGVSWRSSGTSAAAVVAGYASIRPNGGTTPAGLAILGFRQNNVLVTEASVPASPLIQSGRIYAEVNDPINTGLAIANPNSQAASVSFFFTDSDGNFGNGNTTIPANEQIAKFLDQAPFNSPSTWSGTFTFSSSVPIAVVALRGRTNERGEFLITTLPVTDLNAPAVTGTALFPHFVDGGGWSTKIVLVNPSDSVLSGTVRFVDPLGRPATAALNGQFVFIYSIAPRSSQTFQTRGAGTVLSGSARVVPDTNTRTPSGLAIFAFRQGGITVTEAGVPTITAGTAFRLYAEIDGPIQTGIAVVNNSTNATAVTLELSKLDGTSVGVTGTLSIPPNGQTAVFLSEVPGFGSLQTPFQGVLRVSSPESISVIGLRGHYNERNDFLITTIPPVNEAAPPATEPLFFPHIADSGGYTTQFILFSAQPGSSSSGTMQLFNQSGGALGLTLR